MSAIQPKTWEGNFALVEKKAGSGVYTLQPRQTGKYSAENLQEALKALISNKAKLDGWKVWLDGDFEVKLDKGQDVTAAMLAKIVKQADDIQLAFVKRPFPQPKLKFTIGDGTGPARKAAANPAKEL
jgi:hypothetical protein